LDDLDAGETIPSPRPIFHRHCFDNGLDEKAIVTTITWRFEPTTKDGVPVASHIPVQVDFPLK
jgi:hypothetical protein